MVKIQMDAIGRATCAGLLRFAGPQVGDAGRQARRRPAPLATFASGSFRMS